MRAEARCWLVEMRPFAERVTQSHMWVVPTEAFQRERYTPEHRPWMWDILNQCADPERALRNWMDRDVGFARQIVRQAQTLELKVIEVDGTRSIAENAKLAAKHFQLLDRGKDR